MRERRQFRWPERTGVTTWLRKRRRLRSRSRCKLPRTFVSVTFLLIVNYAVFRDAYMQMPLPEIMPAFQSLLVDDLGWLWAELYRPVETDQPEWMVFDPEGRAHGILKTPKGLRIYHIGRDFVLGSWRDELDVDHVRRHRLRRNVTQ